MYVSKDTCEYIPMEIFKKITKNISKYILKDICKDIS